MADDCVQNSTNDNVAHFKSMKAMNTEASAATSDLILKELEHVISLVGPAKEEITKLQLELTHHQIIPERIDSEHVEKLRQLETTKREYQELQKQLMNEKHKNEAQYNEKVIELQNAIAKIRELEAMKHSTKQKEEIMLAQHKEEIDAYKEVNGNTELHLKSTLEKVKELEGAEKRLELRFTDEIRKQQQEITKITASLQKMKMEKENVEKSLSETQSRLSKLMGDKLSDNNPDIADLSDNNRPTKLAEKYQEVYDNQWTDAFEVAEDYFGDKSESYRIKVLNRILMRAYTHCEQEFKRRDQELLQALYRTRAIEKTPQDLPATVKSLLKELKRLAVTDAIGNLNEGYLQGLDTKTSFGEFNLKVKPYISECISLCWLMVCQDPPNALHMNVKQGDQFDNNRYKHYTLTGTLIDYVVWPALLLYQKGPVLSKGIVQCAKPIQGSKSVKDRSRQVDAEAIGIPTRSVRLSSSEKTIETTKRFSGNTSNDSGNVNKSGQKLTQQNKNNTHQQDQKNFDKQGIQNSADAKDNTKHQQPSREHEHPCQQQSPTQQLDQVIKTKDQQNRQPNQPLNLYHSEAKVHFHANKQSHSNTEGSTPNQHEACSYQENQPSPGILQDQQPATDNYQLNQPAIARQQQKHPNTSINVPIQNQKSTHPPSGSNQQIAQVLSATDQSVNQQQNIPINMQTNSVQYPAHLMPTEEEYNIFLTYSNYYRDPYTARYHMGAQIYDKCWYYLAWSKSLQ